ncbi:MAG: 3-oxoacyl-ACP synthase [Treponema sp.]|nr:3-oxoacyl-ACP synthase [Treponema sp.]
MKKKSYYLSATGLICAAGKNPAALWRSVTTGCTDGFQLVELPDGTKVYAGKITDDWLPVLPDDMNIRLFRIEQAALNQIEKDIVTAKLKYGASRIAVCIGSTDNGTDYSVPAHRKFFKNGTFPENYTIARQAADIQSAYIRQKYGLSGITAAFATACSSSAGALATACDLLAADLADAVIAGGVDLASDTAIAGFNSLKSVSAGRVNPFSRNRDGITIGEAAAFFLVTKEKSENSVRILGIGESSDANHMTAPLADGSGAAAAMQRALNAAALAPQDIDYINLHGTGTMLNDSMEAKGIKTVFGNVTDRIPVSTTKSVTGHTLGAAGALEAAICQLVLLQNRNKPSAQLEFPVQVWDRQSDESMPVLNFVNEKHPENTTGKVTVCMSNSFAFGGCNISLLLGC